MEKEAAHLRARAGPGRGPDALPVPLSMEQALDAWTGAACTQNGVPGGFFRTHLPVGFSPGLCEVAVPDGYPMAGQRVQFMIHPSTPASTKTVLIPLPAQPAAGGAAYPAFPQPGVPLSSQAFRPPASAPGPPGMAPPITQNHMAGPGPSQPAQFGHPDGFGKAAIFMAVDDASRIKTVHDVKPFALKLCYGGAAKKRWYFKIQENRLENNRPLFLWPLCCMESCICDWTNVKYFDKLGYNLCCVIPCPGHLVSYKETIYCCFCCDCHCCYDAFCRPCFGEYVAIVPCDNVIAKRCCGLALPYPGLECIENSEEVAANINVQRGAATARAHRAGKQRTV